MQGKKILKTKKHLGEGEKKGILTSHCLEEDNRSSAKDREEGGPLHLHLGKREKKRMILKRER